MIIIIILKDPLHFCHTILIGHKAQSGHPVAFEGCGCLWLLNAVAISPAYQQHGRVPLGTPPTE